MKKSKFLKMHKKHKDAIKQHFPVLVDTIEPENLAKYLLKQGIFTKKEVRKILAEKGNFKHNNRLLIFQLLKKSDTAYPIFVKGLEEFKLKHLFTPSNSRSHITVFTLGNENRSNEEFIDFSNLNLHSPIERSNEAASLITAPLNTGKPLEVRVRLATSFPEGSDNDNVYKTKSSNRGQVLIINNKYFNNKHPVREGSEQDVKNLESLFKQMFLNVTIYTDLSVKEMENVIQQFAAYESDKISDICVVIVMSHGEERNNAQVILDKSNDGLSTKWIEDQFNNVNCSLFHGKPKIFLYQLCRGTQHDYAITSSQRIDRGPSLVSSHINDGSSVQTDSGHMLGYIERRKDDMLIGHATQQGHRAHRDRTFGSWYIQLICQIFMEKAHNTDIVNMLNEVDRQLKFKATPQYTMQTSSYTSDGFNKLLFFNPGIYIDEHGNTQKFVQSNL